MHILLQISTIHRQVAWTAATCPHCGQVEAIRLEDVVRVCRIWFIPVSRWVDGKAARCDLCERPLHLDRRPTEVPLADWSPEQGMDALAQRCGWDQRIEVPAESPDERLHSLLSSVRDASSASNVDTTFGLVVGLICGAGAGLLSGSSLHKAGVLDGRMDRLGVIMLAVMIGGLLGAVAGSAYVTLFGRGRVARSKIKAAYAKYNLDARRLELLAQAYPNVVHRAVVRVRDSA